MLGSLAGTAVICRPGQVVQKVKGNAIKIDVKEERRVWDSCGIPRVNEISFKNSMFVSHSKASIAEETSNDVKTDIGGIFCQYWITDMCQNEQLPPEKITECLAKSYFSQQINDISTYVGFLL